MPEWSNAGHHVVFIRLAPESQLFYECAEYPSPRPAGGDWLVCDGGDVVVMSYDAGELQAVRVLIPRIEGREYHYYPTWSPDDRWILFNTGTRPGWSEHAQGTKGYGIQRDRLVSYDQTTSRLRLMSVSGGNVIELVRAGMGTGNTASWPKFTPFVQRTGTLLFFTFSARSAYGFVVPPGARPQLWMSAVDLSRPEGTVDPSFAPAWLPFQDAAENNHLGVWTRRAPCRSNADCPDEFPCEMGDCRCPSVDGCKK